jgi:glutathione S-transferase
MLLTTAYTTSDTLSTHTLDSGTLTQVQYLQQYHRLTPIKTPTPHHLATPKHLTMSTTSNSQPQYELLYHPSIPGRAEFIRLCFEATHTPYLDVSNSLPNGYSTVQKTCMDPTALSSCDNNPPVFSPPALRIPGAGPKGGALLISQTPNILIYLGEKLGLQGGEGERWHVNQLALTALDLNNEIHDTHHPIAVGKYYEEQKEAALAKAKDVRENRLPKFLSYFERVLKHNEKEGGGKGRYLVGGKLTFADLVVWQVMDGLGFAFPREMDGRKKEFPDLFGEGGFYEGVKGEDGVREYLRSGRRLDYGDGVFRYYEELDRE